MPTLTIRFIEMFLYVRRPKDKQHMVLLPRGSGKHLHSATIEGSGVNETLQQTAVEFCHRVGGKMKPIPGSQRREPPSHVRLVELKDILGRKGVAQTALLDQTNPFPPSLNARVLLPNGRGVAERARKPKADDVEWTFDAREGLPRIEGQELTDFVQVVIDVQPNADLFAVFSNRDPVRLEPFGQGDYLVTFRNRDEGCEGNEVPPGDYTLEEYQFLYELTHAESDLYRYPMGTYGDTGANGNVGRSNCLPICGGAKCDEGDPPP